MKKIYNYDRKTGEYLNSTCLNKDDFGNYNMPAFSTDIEPKLIENNKAIFNKVLNVWEYVELFKYKYIVDSFGFITNKSDGAEINTNFECPNEYYYKYVIGENWVIDKDKQIEFLTNEVYQLRRGQYKSIGDALDSIYKEFNYRRMQGEKFTQEFDDWLTSCTTVKTQNPLPKKTEVN